MLQDGHVMTIFWGNGITLRSFLSAFKQLHKLALAKEGKGLEIKSYRIAQWRNVQEQGTFQVEQDIC